MSNASNKFFGKVGYVITVDNGKGVSIPTSIVREYYGDIQTYSTRWQTADKLNDDIMTRHRISIIADPYAVKNFPYIKFVEWMGTKWEVGSIEVLYPRLILTLGGVYNG